MAVVTSKTAARMAPIVPVPTCRLGTSKTALILPGHSEVRNVDDATTTTTSDTCAANARAKFAAANRDARVVRTRMT